MNISTLGIWVSVYQGSFWVLNNLGAIYSRCTCVNLEMSWGHNQVCPWFHLRRSLSCPWQFWPSPSCWSSLLPDLLWAGLLSQPALWLGNSPKFGPQPLVAFFLIYSPLALSPTLTSVLGLYLPFSSPTHLMNSSLATPRTCWRFLVWKYTMLIKIAYNAYQK